MGNCPEYDRLASEVENALGNLAQVNVLLLELFRQRDARAFKRFDKDLEVMMGEKERAIGALRQHVKDHQCQPEEPI